MFVVGIQKADKFLPLEDDDPLKDSVYRVLMTYQLPMGFMLPEGDYGTLIDPSPNGEQLFLEKKLKELSPDLGIAYISTTLWELYAQAYMAEDIYAQILSGSYLGVVNKHRMIDFEYDFTSARTREELLEMLHAYNFKPEIQETYLKINDEILSDFNSASADNLEKQIKELSLEKVQEQLNRLINFTQLSAKSSGFWYYETKYTDYTGSKYIDGSTIFRIPNPEPYKEGNAQYKTRVRYYERFWENFSKGEESLIHSVVKKELERPINDAFWLYRGTQKSNYNFTGVLHFNSGKKNLLVDSTLRIHSIADALEPIDLTSNLYPEQHVLSYGQTLFSATVYDPGAEAIGYSGLFLDAQNEKYPDEYEWVSYFYRIAVKKSDLRQHDNSSHYGVRPLNNLVLLLSKGFQFHPFTRVAKVDICKKVTTSNYFVSRYLENPDCAAKYSRQGDPLDTALQVSSDLENAELLYKDKHLPTDEDLNWWTTILDEQKRFSQFLKSAIQEKAQFPSPSVL